MKKKFISAIAVFSLLALGVSCTDDFVDRKPPYSMDGENYFNSKQDYEQALIGVYDLLQSTYINVLMGEIASDNTFAGGESATDVPGFVQIDQMSHTPVNPQLKNLWDWMFAGVNRANYILEFKDKTDFDGKEHIIAQTRFLRAYYHFELVKWFGAIPLKGDTRFLLGDETTIPRSATADVYAEIESDLQYAVANLDPNESIPGRVTVGAAQALLGKVYLYQNKYPQAAEAFEGVISSGKYSLVQDFGTIFNNDNENNSESVFEVQYTDAEGGSFTCLQCAEGNVAVGFNGPRAFDGPFYESGYSFNVPTQQAYDSFESGDLRRDASILNVVAFGAQYADWENADYRAGRGEKGVLYGRGYQHTGFFNRKYLPQKGDANIPDVNLTNPNNYRAIRYADVLLMAAEAYNKAGNDTKALQYVNMVRARAFGDNNHNLSGGGAGLGDLIWKERRSELVGEGHRFFDLVRTGRGAEIPGFTPNKNEVFPIPIEEIQFSNGNWQQNPGY